MKSRGQNKLAIRDQVCTSTCPYCGVGCGVDITFGQTSTCNVNTIKKVEGTLDHPANFGKLCVKGSNLRETNGAAGRLLSPMVNGRAVSWLTAIDSVATRFNQIIDQHGPDSVAFYVSGQLLTEDYYVANKLMKGYIGSANIDTNSRLCMSSAVAAYKRAFGADAMPCCYEDLDIAELIVLIGSNAAWTHPVLFQRIERAKKLNPALKVVVIDPRKTPSCSIADLHLQLKPGSDVALFNGLLAFLNNYAGFDQGYIDSFTEGFSNTIEKCMDWDVERVSEYCNLDTKDLCQFYQLFMKTERALSFYSMGVNQSSQGVDKANAIINCHLATGKIGKEGCGPFSITGQPNAMGGREVGGLANMLAAHMDLENADHMRMVQNYWKSPAMPNKTGLKAVDLFDKIAQGEVKAVWIMATNPVVSMPNRQQIELALKGCEFVVASDCVEHNDTLNFADVKLPATGWSEKNGTVTNSERRISRQRGVLKPLGEARHDWQIICDVAKAMGFNKGFNFLNPAEIFNEHAGLSGLENNGTRDFDISGLHNLSVKEYDELKPVQWPINERNPYGSKRLFTDNRFFTRSGKAQFIAVSPEEPEQKTSNNFPFILNTGRIRDQWHTMTRTAKSHELMQHTEQAFLHVHPDDAAPMAVGNDDLLEITAAHSVSDKVILPAKLDPDLLQNSLFAPIHWSLQWASSAGIAGLFTNARDRISGQPELKHGAVKIQKAKFKSRLTIFVKNEDDIPALSNVFPYWVKIPFKQGFQVEAACDKTPADVLNELTGLINHGQQWISTSTDNSAIKIGMVDDLPICLFAVSDSKPNIPSDWIKSVFVQSDIDRVTIHGLLSGQPSPDFTLGKVICTCHNVRESTIIRAIHAGSNSVESLGEKLQCGTNCGSCKSELGALVDLHKASLPSEKLIPIKTVEMAK